MEAQNDSDDNYSGKVYIQGFNAMEKLGKECGRFGNKGFFVCDPFVHENLLPRLCNMIAGEIDITVEKFSGEWSDEEIVCAALKAADAYGEEKKL